MRIGELAKRSGVSRDTVRFYERNGLITSVAGQSDTNNYRDYPEDNLIRLDFFTRARTAGMSIADMRDIIEAMDGRCDAAVARQVVASKVAELKDRASQIQRVIAFLERGLEGEGDAPDPGQTPIP
ncbi:MerR family transcriptional regulator [Antarctobacter jejuensis]|uniref:MerR family transcriptional regulator n=1 Tax=Antarctobacter jejuensis TaxID=1439938 RepID=UPI003FD19781